MSSLTFTLLSPSEPSRYAPQYFVHADPVVCRDDTDECARASFANALRLIDGKDSALEYWTTQPLVDEKNMKEKGYRDSFRMVSHLTSSVEEHVRGVTLKHLHRPDGTRMPNPGSRYFTDRRLVGIFVVTLFGSGGILHSICIDTRKAPGVIYDSSEEFAMKLCPESLMLCVGDNSQFQGIRDVREVVRFCFEGEFGEEEEGQVEVREEEEARSCGWPKQIR